jgi:hypothetical protein
MVRFAALKFPDNLPVTKILKKDIITIFIVGPVTASLIFRNVSKGSKNWLLLDSK